MLITLGDFWPTVRQIGQLPDTLTDILGEESGKVSSWRQFLSESSDIIWDGFFCRQFSQFDTLSVYKNLQLLIIDGRFSVTLKFLLKTK